MCILYKYYPDEKMEHSEPYSPKSLFCFSLARPLKHIDELGVVIRTMMKVHESMLTKFPCYLSVKTLMLYCRVYWIVLNLNSDAQKRQQ